MVEAAHLLILRRNALDELLQGHPQLYCVLLRRALTVTCLRLDKVSERLATVL